MSNGEIFLTSCRYVVGAVLLMATISGAAARAGANGESAGKYQPTWESLDRHRTPAWFTPPTSAQRSYSTPVKMKQQSVTLAP